MERQKNELPFHLKIIKIGLIIMVVLTFAAFFSIIVIF